jgi:hypothetical protein
VVQGNGSAVAGEARPRQYANNGCNPGQGAAWARRRLKGRADVSRLAQWRHWADGEPPAWDRVRTCASPIGSHVELRAKGDRGVYPVNVETCGYVWGDPVCGHKVRVRRAFEVMAAAEAWAARGGTLGMVTLTVRHHKWMSLSDVREAVRVSWRKLRNRKEYRSLRSVIFGTIKALEVKVGENGWHVHLHVLLFLQPGAENVAAMVGALHDPWSELVTAKLGVSPSRAHGIDYRPMGTDAAAYVSKVGYEIASSGTKGGRDPLDLLDEAVCGDADAFHRVMEFLDGMRGVRSLDWSKLLRDRLGLAAEKSDEELALEDEDGEHVAFIEASVWRAALRNRDEDGVPVVWNLMQQYEAAWRKERATDA